MCDLTASIQVCLSGWSLQGQGPHKLPPCSPPPLPPCSSHSAQPPCLSSALPPQGLYPCYSFCVDILSPPRHLCPGGLCSLGPSLTTPRPPHSLLPSPTVFSSGAHSPPSVSCFIYLPAGCRLPALRRHLGLPQCGRCRMESSPRGDRPLWRGPCLSALAWSFLP